MSNSTVADDSLRQKLLQWQQKKGRIQPERLPWEPRFRKPKVEDPVSTLRQHDVTSSKTAKPVKSISNKENDPQNRLTMILQKFKKMELEAKHDSEAVQRAARRAEYAKALRDRMKQQPMNKRSTLPSTFHIKSSVVVQTSVKPSSSQPRVLGSKRPTFGLKNKKLRDPVPKSRLPAKSPATVPKPKSTFPTDCERKALQPKPNTANVSISKTRNTPKPLTETSYYLVKPKTPRKSFGVDATPRKSILNQSSVSVRVEEKDEDLKTSETASEDVSEILNTTFEMDVDDAGDDTDVQKTQRAKSRKSVSFFVPCLELTPEANGETCDAESDQASSTDTMKSFAGHTPRYNKDVRYEKDDAGGEVCRSPNELLAHYLELLVSGCPYAEISAKMDALRDEVPSVEQLAKYWFCRSQVAVQSGNVNEALRLFDLALAQRTEPVEEMHAGVLDLKQRISRSTRKSCHVDAKNAFGSSTLKFCVSTPHKSFSDLPAYTVTPVRRSARFDQPQKSVSFEPELQLPICIDSVENLPPKVRRSVLYKSNPALSDWDIAVEYGEQQVTEEKEEIIPENN